jgi:hypothetical protein
VPDTDDSVDVAVAEKGHMTENGTVTVMVASVRDESVTRPTVGAPEGSQAQSRARVAGSTIERLDGFEPGNVVLGASRVTAPPQSVAVACIAPTPALSQVSVKVEPPLRTAPRGEGARRTPRMVNEGVNPVVAGRRSIATPRDQEDDVDVSAQSAASSVFMSVDEPVGQEARSAAERVGHPVLRRERVGTSHEAAVIMGPARE